MKNKKRRFKSVAAFLMACLLIAASTSASFAFNGTNSSPDSINSHLKNKVIALDGISDTHQWVTDYDEATQPKFRCYTYALGVTDMLLAPGDTVAGYMLKNTLLKKYVDVNTVADWVLKDVKNLGASARILTGADSRPDYPTKSNEFLIALRVSPKSTYETGNINSYNYHFMRRISDGCWRYKAGDTGRVIQLEEGYTPETVTWDVLISDNGVASSYNYKQYAAGFYTSDIVYMVVTANSSIQITADSFNIVTTQAVDFTNNIPQSLGIGASYLINPAFTPVNASYQNFSYSARSVNGVRIVKFDSKVNHKMKTLAAGTVTVGAFNVDTRQYYEFNVTVSDVLLGDVDGNGLIEVKDITLLQNYMAGAAELTQKQMKAADVNSNGSVTLQDVLMIQQYVAKKIDSFAVEQIF
ncbi:MAG: dockerin type I repeat-containing protein [Christensenellales bacterium]